MSEPEVPEAERWWQAGSASETTRRQARAADPAYVAPFKADLAAFLGESRRAEYVALGTMTIGELERLRETTTDLDKRYAIGQHLIEARRRGPVRLVF